MLIKKPIPINFLIKKYILICVGFMLLIHIISHSLYGLYTNLNYLEEKSNNYLLLISDSIVESQDINIDVFNKQRADILKENKTFTAIDMYSFSEELSLSEDSSKNGFLHLLNEDEYHVTKNIYPDTATQKNNENLHEFAGYIKLTINLQHFKKQFFKQNIIVYVFLVSLYAIFAMLLINIFITLHRPAERLNKLSKKALYSDEFIALPQYNINSIVDEYQMIELALYNISAKYNKLSNTIKEQEQHEIEVKQKKELIVHQRNDFQNLITNELKTSLNIMTGGLQLLGQQYLNQEQQDALAIIRKSNYQLNFMLEQISQLNKIEKNEVSRNFVDLNPIQVISDLMSTAEDQAKKKNIDLMSNISHIDHMLEGDVDKIRNILSALLDNAIKYTSTGNITIESSLQHFDESTRWLVKIIDTGIGIDEMYFIDIFTPFFQIDNDINSNAEGIGVGLSISKQLSDIIDADILVSHNVEQGMCFELVMMLFDKKQSAKRTILQNVHICSINDSDDSSLCKNLEKFGAQVSAIYDYENLLTNFASRNSDVLLINSSMEFSQVLILVEKIRMSEDNQRALIFWFVNDIHSIDETKTAAVGIDVILDSSIEMRELAETISKWLN